MTAWRFLFISLVLHVAFWISVAKYAELQPKFTKNEKIDIQIIEKNPKFTSLAPSLPPALRLKNLKPKFPDPSHKRATEEDQYVERETHAPNLGLFNPVVPTKLANRKSDQEEKETSSSEEGTVALKKMGKRLFTENASDPLIYENAEVGSITALNGQSLQFYAFNSRIQGAIVNRWTQNLRFYQSRWGNNDIEKLNGRTWSTLVEIILDSNGYYKDFILYRSSGVDEIDAAAIKVFKSISYFPNPPRDMVEKDGTVRLKYNFNFIVPPARQMARQSSQ